MTTDKRNPISTGSEWTFELINEYDREIALSAEKFELDTYPNQIEIISAAHTFGSSEDVFNYLRENVGRSIYGISISQESWESQEGIDMYIYNQYVLKLPKESGYFKIPVDEYNYYEYICDKTIPELKKKRNLIVDLGCGAGGLLHYLRKNTQMSIGVDISFPAALEAQRIHRALPTKKKNYSFYKSSQNSELRELDIGCNLDAHFLVGDATNPPVRDQIADLVTSVNILEIVSNPITLVDSIQSILKDSGIWTNSSPYYWRNDRSPKDTWLSSSTQSNEEYFEHYVNKSNFEVLVSIDRVPWPLRVYDRYWQWWETHLLVSRNRC